MHGTAKSTGTILFGGYDTDKYEGELTILDIQPDAQANNAIDAMIVAWSFMGVTTPKGQTVISSPDFPIPAILDSGTSLTAVPQDIYNVLVAAFQPDSNGYIPCNIGSGSFDYGFGGADTPQVSVPFSELAVPVYDTKGKPLTFTDGSTACQFGFQAAPGGTVLLGDTFLRSAYVVYDLDAQIIGIAPAVFNSSSSNIQQIPAANATDSPLGTSVSYVTGAQVTQTASVAGPYGPVDSTAVLTSSATRGNGNGQPTGTSTSYAVKTPLGVSVATASSGSSSTSSTKGAAAGLAAPTASSSFGVVVAVVALVAGGFASGIAFDFS